MGESTTDGEIVAGPTGSDVAPASPDRRRLPSLANLMRFAQVAFGKGFWAALGLAVSAVLARSLQPADFGLYSLSVAVSVVVLELIGSEGIDNSLVRFGALELSRESGNAGAVLRLALAFKVALALLMIPLGVLLAGPIARRVLDKPEAVMALLLGVLIGGGMSLWRYFLAVLQSGQRFAHYAWLQVLPNLLKFLGVIALFAVAVLTLDSALYVSMGSYLAGIAAGALLCRRSISEPGTVTPELRRDFTSFVGWLILVNLFSAAYSRIDVLMMSAFLPAAEVGIYSAALILAGGLDLLYTSWLVFLFPTVSGLKTRAELSAFYRRALKYSVFLALSVMPLLFLARPLIELVFSTEFSDAVVPFRILLVGLLFTISLNPLLLFIYARARPQGLVAINAASLMVAIAGHAWAIPRYGIVGAAVVASLTRALTAVAIALLSARLVRQAPAEPATAENGASE